MEQLLRFALLWALIIVPWSARSQAVNYECDFEEITMATGWSTSNADATNQWVIGTAVNHTTDGGTGMYISNDNGATHAYGTGTTFACIYHEMALTEGLYDLSYDWMCVGEAQVSYYYTDYYDYLRVALVPVSESIPTERPSTNFYNTLPSGWIALDGGQALCNQATWKHHAMEVEIATAGNYRLVFCWYNDNSGSDGVPAAIDNVVMKTQTCPKPTGIVASEISATGATIGWSENGNATAWNIEYGISGFERGTGQQINATDSNVVLTGLQSNTVYDIYVESACGVGDISRAEKGNFRTGCGALTLPYTEDFEAYENTSFPDCWTLREGLAQIYNFSTYAHSGMQSLEIKSDAVILLPTLSGEVNEMGLYLAAKQSFETSGDLEIGYVSDTATWDYVALRRITPMDGNYHQYEIDMDALSTSTQGGYIVIRQLNTTSQWSSWYLDDIEVFELGTCRAPKAFAIEQITHNSAVLSWSCATDGAKFEVSYGDTLVEIEFYDMVTLNELEPNTTYYPQIRAIYGGDTSYWQEMGFFRTEALCDQVELLKVEPITTTQAVVQWRYSNRGNQHSEALLRYKAMDSLEWQQEFIDGNGYFITGLNADTEYEVELLTICDVDTSEVKHLEFKTPSGNCGEIVSDENRTSYRVPLNGGNKYSYSQSLYDGAVARGIDSITGIAYWTANHDQSRTLKIYMGNTTKVKFNKASEYVPHEEMTLVYEGTVNFSGNDWDSITFNTAFATNGENIVVCISDETGSSSSNKVKFRYHKGSSIYKNTNNGVIAPTDSYVNTLTEVPDIRFIGVCQAPTCQAPLLCYSDGDATSITFNWRPGLDEEAWVVRYKAEGADEWISYNEHATDTTVTLTELMSGKGYELLVGSICQGDTLYATAMGYTECGVMGVPYYDDFESKEINSCWRLHSVYPNGELPRIRNGELEIAANSYVIMPLYEEAINTLELKFKLDDVGKGVPLYVGVCTEQNNPSTFVGIDTVYMNSLDPNAELTVHMSDYDGYGEYIALKGDIYPVYIDSLTVSYVAICPTATNIMASDMGGTYLTLDWEGDETMSWTATIVAHGGAIEDGIALECDAPTVTFEGLTINTSYDIYITTHCGERHSATVSTTIKTLATDPLDLPYETDFGNEMDNEQWSTYSHMGENLWVIGSAVGNGDEMSLYVSDDEGVSNHYANNSASATMAYIPITIGTDGDYFVAYDWRNKGKTDWDFCRVALVPITYNFATAPTNRFGYDNILPTGWIAMDNGNMQGVTTWQRTTKRVALNEGKYYLTFVWLNDGGGGQNPPIAIDNIKLQAYECTTPTGLMIDEITPNSAMARWDANEMVSNGWELTLNDNEAIMVEEHQYRFEQLNSGTHYQITVKARCDEETLSEALVGEFETPCEEITQLPYMNGFETEVAGALPHCWMSKQGIATVEQGELRINSMPSAEQATQWVWMPRLADNYEMERIELMLKAKSDIDGEMLYVGICDSMGDEAQYVEIDSLELNTEWQEWLMTFENYEGGNGYITFKTGLETSAQHRVTIDYVRMQEMSSCGRPTELRVSCANRHSATLHWEDTNSMANYKVALSTTDDIATADTIVEGIAEKSYTFEGLNSTTTYYGWVATVCSDTTSRWVATGAFVIADIAPCEMPVIAEADSIENEQATIHWSGEGEQYEVAIEDSTMAIAVTGNSYRFEGLEPDSTYEYYVRQICDETYYSPWAMGSFTTTNINPCQTPQALTVVAMDYEQMTINWEAAEGQGQWIVNIYNEMETYRDTVTEKPYRKEGLSIGETYKVAVKAICSERWSSEWSDTLTLQLPTCEKIHTIQVYDITPHTAQVGWTASGTEHKWKIAYGEKGFEKTNGTMIETDVPYYMMKGLEADKSYEVYVQAICTEANYSEWSEAIGFKTLSEESPEGIENIAGKYEIEIYPNPTQGATTISIEGVNGEVSISIVDMNGRSVMHETINCGGDCQKKMDVRRLPQGSYFVRIVGDKINCIKKLIVK